MNALRWRDHGPSVLVAALASAFGVTLLQLTDAIAVMLGGNSESAESNALLAVLLMSVAMTFIVIAIYVSSIVTANTFATIIAGRTRQIALARLIGSTAAQQRRAVAREGVLVGLVGALVGALVGTAVSAVVLTLGVLNGSIPKVDYTYLPPSIALPIIAVVLTTWAASWVGSRRVLTVTPLAALGAAQDTSYEEAAARTGRWITSVILGVTGALFLALGVVVGLATPLGILIGVVGGVFSFTGIVLGAHRVMPVALRIAGRLLGRTAPRRLAAENAMRYPERSARTTIGLVIGVTLVTMFVVVAETYAQALRSISDSEAVDSVIAVTVGVFSVLIGFSSLIAAVGMVNNLSLSVFQRTRELGLLRALGFTARQLRAMVRAEAAQLTIAALLTGTVLGVVYGWAGAQSLLGSITKGFVVPVVPWWLVVGVAVVGFILTLVASAVPARRATRVSPVVALATV